MVLATIIFGLFGDNFAPSRGGLGQGCCNHPAPELLADDLRRDLNWKQVKAIGLLQATVKDYYSHHLSL